MMRPFGDLGRIYHPNGNPIGTQKSHVEPQGDHLSLQECVLKGAFQDLPFLLRLYTLNRVKTSDFWIALCGRNAVNSVSKQHFSQPFSKLGFELVWIIFGFLFGTLFRWTLDGYAYQGG